MLPPPFVASLCAVPGDKIVRNPVPVAELFLPSSA